MIRSSTQYGGGVSPVSATEPTRSLAVTALVLAVLVGGLIASVGSAAAVPTTATNETTPTMVPPTSAASAADAPPAPTPASQEGLPAVTGPAAAAGVVAGVTIGVGLFVRQGA